MDSTVTQLLLFTDVDGCLLNKSDYDFRPAVPALDRLGRLGIPVILSSSKTGSELQALANELRLKTAPLICENGGTILWRRPADCPRTKAGVSRDRILNVLTELKAGFRFRSFADLQLEGVMAATDLPAEQAAMALDRHSTEPLLWDDDAVLIEAFREKLAQAQLTLTKGGRFWHVAGKTTKGDAMKVVTEWYGSRADSDCLTIAIGDSPIDQSMLDIADYPIGIPAPDGSHNVDVAAPPGVLASNEGAEGWAASVSALLDRLGFSR